MDVVKMKPMFLAIALMALVICCVDETTAAKRESRMAESVLYGDQQRSMHRPTKKNGPTNWPTEATMTGSSATNREQPFPEFFDYKPYRYVDRQQYPADSDYYPSPPARSTVKRNYQKRVAEKRIPSKRQLYKRGAVKKRRSTKRRYPKGSKALRKRLIRQAREANMASATVSKKRKRRDAAYVSPREVAQLEDMLARYNDGYYSSSMDDDNEDDFEDDDEGDVNGDRVWVEDEPIEKRSPWLSNIDDDDESFVEPSPYDLATIFRVRDDDVITPIPDETDNNGEENIGMNNNDLEVLEDPEVAMRKRAEEIDNERESAVRKAINQPLMYDVVNLAGVDGIFIPVSQPKAQLLKQVLGSMEQKRALHNLQEMATLLGRNERRK